MEDIYSNKNIKNRAMRGAGEESSSDDVVYSEVHIIDSNQKRAPAAAKEQVIYSTVAFSNPADLDTSHLPGPNDPGDPSLEERLKVITTAQVKERRLLVSLCVLLFAVALISAVLHGFEKPSHKDQKQMNDIREMNSTIDQLQAGKENLTRELEKKNSRIEQLQAEKGNLTRELKTLKGEGDQCDKGWKVFRGKCYFFSTDMKYWTASRDACVAMGGDLVIINSPEEKEFMAKSKVGPIEKYWLGLTDAVTEKDWRWIDGTKLSDEPKYWTGKEPDNWIGKNKEHPEGEDCGVMEIGSGGGGFLDTFCNRGGKRKRICEVNAAA